MGRMACVVLAAVILLSSVIFGQKYLHDVLTDIAESADRVCVFLAENKGLEGEAALQSLLLRQSALVNTDGSCRENGDRTPPYLVR